MSCNTWLVYSMTLTVTEAVVYSISHSSSNRFHLLVMLKMVGGAHIGMFTCDWLSAQKGLEVLNAAILSR